MRKAVNVLTLRKTHYPLSGLKVSPFLHDTVHPHIVTEAGSVPSLELLPAWGIPECDLSSMGLWWCSSNSPKLSTLLNFLTHLCKVKPPNLEYGLFVQILAIFSACTTVVMTSWNCVISFLVHPKQYWPWKSQQDPHCHRAGPAAEGRHYGEYPCAVIIVFTHPEGKLIFALGRKTTQFMTYFAKKRK